MRLPRLRPAIDRLSLWWRGVGRRTIRKVGNAAISVVPSLLIPAGWFFITWSMFLWNPRAWAASIGIFLFLSGLTPVIEAYLAAKKAASLRSIDR